jgi:hypothetical protein
VLSEDGTYEIPVNSILTYCNQRRIQKG